MAGGRTLRSPRIPAGGGSPTDADLPGYDAARQRLFVDSGFVDLEPAQAMLLEKFRAGATITADALGAAGTLELPPKEELAKAGLPKPDLFVEHLP